MSEPDDNTVRDVLFDMEDDLLNIERWSAVLLNLGMCQSDVQALGLYGIGEALERAAKILRRRWTEAVELTRVDAEEAPLNP